MFYAYHPDDIREVAEIYGIDPKELARPMEYMFSGGLEKLSKFRKALEFLLYRRHLRDEDETRARFPDDPDNDVFGKMDDEYEREKEKAYSPLWKIISGIEDVQELPQFPRERRRALTIIINAIEKLIRHELEFAESDEIAIANSLSYMQAATERTAPSLLTPRKRSIYWTPLSGICAAMGISKIALTRFGQELVGRSAHELVDDIVVEKVHKKMAEMLHPKLRRMFVKEFGDNWDKKIAGVKARDIWKRIKAERVEPEFCRVAWAQKFGFPNYNRFNRACLTVHGMSPHQVELQVIEEFLDAVQELQGSGVRGQRQGSGVRGQGSETATATATPADEAWLGAVESHPSHASHQSHEGTSRAAAASST
ncbi:MAG TPA: hypothetical protein VEJ63_01605, partial [Planctomycetota bacterium]|nr:hypothetical protein [Planctomycetota bacterium]